MFDYYLELAWQSLRRHRLLTALMVLAIALGIGTSMTTLTVLHVLSGDPIPQKSAQLFRVRMSVFPDGTFKPGDKVPDNLTRRDAEALLHDARADRQTMTSAGSMVVMSAQGDPLNVEARYASADFFPMFDVPLRYGQAWSRDDDASRARVAVISNALNEQLFGGRDSVGQTLQIGEEGLRLDGGKIAVDAEGKTSMAKVWAGGDCATGGEDLTVTAVAEGRDDLGRAADEAARGGRAHRGLLLGDVDHASVARGIQVGEAHETSMTSTTSPTATASMSAGTIA